MASKRMTANPIRPTRYRPGKGAVSESDDDESSDDEQATITPSKSSKASTHASQPSQVSGISKPPQTNRNLAKVAADQEAERLEQKAIDEGFVTEDEMCESSDRDQARSFPLSGVSSSDGDSGGSESESEESSSDDDPPQKLMRPTFIRKEQRASDNIPIGTNNNWAEDEEQRKRRADAIILERLELDAAARSTAKKEWDDDQGEFSGEVDDTDHIDSAIEFAAWKLRELKRIKRERETIEAAEKEREEIERRRNLSQQDRDAEDRAFLDDQKEEREGRGKMSFMQKYYHKGAFFQDDAKAAGLADRDLMGSRIADDVVNREILPEFMQIRDMTKLGKKGRTRYKDLRTEDTSASVQDFRRGAGNSHHLDERFQPDRPGTHRPTGSNMAPLGRRRSSPSTLEQFSPRGRKRSTSDTDNVDKRARVEPN